MPGWPYLCVRFHSSDHMLWCPCPPCRAQGPEAARDVDTQCEGEQGQARCRPEREGMHAAAPCLVSAHVCSAAARAQTVRWYGFTPVLWASLGLGMWPQGVHASASKPGHAAPARCSAPDLRDAALAAAGAQDKLQSQYVSFIGGTPMNVSARWCGHSEPVLGHRGTFQWDLSCLRLQAPACQHEPPER